MRAVSGWMMLALCAVPAMAAPRRSLRAVPRKPIQKTVATAGLAAPRVVRLTLLPASFTLQGPHAGQRLLVMGVLADGSQVDLTDRVKLVSTAPKIAALEGNRVDARADGKTTVTARLGTLSASAAVTVGPDARTRGGR